MDVAASKAAMEQQPSMDAAISKAIVGQQSGMDAAIHKAAVEQQSSMDAAVNKATVEHIAINNAAVDLDGQPNVEAAAMIALLDEMKAAVAALEVTVEYAMLEECDEVQRWKGSAMAEFQSDVQSAMDAVSNVEFVDVKQPIVDAVATCKSKNAWDTKRKNAQKARKRRVMSMDVNGCN